MSITDTPTDTITITSTTITSTTITSTENAGTVETTHVRAAVEAAALRFIAAGVSSPRHDAEELAAFVLGCPRSLVYTAGSFSAGQSVVFTGLVARREARVPLQHLTGSVGFRYLELAVGPGVFVPRPETELMAGWCVDALRASSEEAPLVVDLCTGSGAIALSIAHEVKDSVVHAVELEADAVAWATRNATGSRVTIHHADAGSADALAGFDGTVDLVVSNPPYLPDGEIVEPEVADHDPAAALWGGSDGLAGPRLAEQSARRLLRIGGLLAIEHADQHGAAMTELLAASGAWSDIVVHPDLTGRDRFITATRSEGQAATAAGASAAGATAAGAGLPRPRQAETS